jgi:hypothetical protein
MARRGDILRSDSMANSARRALPAFALAAAATMALVGCGTTPPSTAITTTTAASASPTQSPSKTVPCPQIARYSPDLRNKAAQELDLLPVGSAIEVFLNDYETLRDDLRTCQDDQPKG